MYLNRSDELWIAIQEIAGTHDLDVYDIDRQGAGKLTVVVSRRSQHLLERRADRGVIPGQGGVTSDDCSNLVRELMIYFQANGARFGLLPNVGIEVCSPGVNRSLRLAEHYIAAVGERIKVVFKEKQVFAEQPGGVGSCVGVMMSCDGEILTMSDEAIKPQVERTFRVKDFKKARVEFNFDK